MANPTVRSTTVTTSSLSGTFSVNKPTGTADGDLLVAFETDSGGTPTTPTGWSGLGVSASVGGGGTLQCYYKTASGEPSSWTFNGSGLGANTVVVLAVQNPGSGTPEGGTSASTSGTTTVTIGSITTSRDNGLCLYGFATGASERPAPQGGLTDVAGTATQPGLDVASLAVAVAGAAGTQSATVGVSNNLGGIGLAVLGPAGYSPGSSLLTGWHQIVRSPNRPSRPSATTHDGYPWFDASTIFVPSPPEPDNYDRLARGSRPFVTPRSHDDTFPWSQIANPLTVPPPPPSTHDRAARGPAPFRASAFGSLGQPWRWDEDPALLGWTPSGGSALRGRPVRGALPPGEVLTPPADPPLPGWDQLEQPHRARGPAPFRPPPAIPHPWIGDESTRLGDVPVSCWHQETAALRRSPARSAREATSEVHVEYYALAQPWDVQGPPLRVRQAVRAAAPSAECLGPVTIPDDQQQLGSWRVDTATLRRPQPWRRSPAEGDPVQVVLLDLPPWSAALQEPARAARATPPFRPSATSRRSDAQEASASLLVAAEAANLPVWAVACQPGHWPARRSAPVRPAPVLDELAALAGALQPGWAVPQGWDVQTPALRRAPPPRPAAPEVLVVDTALVTTPVLLPDAGGGLIRRAPAWRAVPWGEMPWGLFGGVAPPAQPGGAPVPVPGGLVIVAGPLYCTALDLWVGGAIVGDVAEGA